MVTTRENPCRRTVFAKYILQDRVTKGSGETFAETRIKMLRRLDVTNIIINH